MTCRSHFVIGTMLLLAGLSLMIYTYNILYGIPYAMAFVLLWLVMVEYAVGRAWWTDVQEFLEVRRSRP